jgi:hypothetical protein
MRGDPFPWWKLSYIYIYDTMKLLCSTLPNIYRLGHVDCIVAGEIQFILRHNKRIIFVLRHYVITRECTKKQRDYIHAHFSPPCVNEIHLTQIYDI